MTSLLAFLVALAAWRSGVSLRRLWSTLPDRNIDFDLSADDMDLERRP